MSEQRAVNALCFFVLSALMFIKCELALIDNMFIYVF